MSVFRFIQSALNQNVIPIYGDGNQARDFTYIDDIVAGTLQARKNLGYSIINLGSGMKNPISINETLAIIESTLKRSIPRQQQTPDKSDMLQTQADISKAEKILGWKPQVPFQEGLQKTIDWHLENDSWLKNIKI